MKTIKCFIALFGIILSGCAEEPSSVIPPIFGVEKKSDINIYATDVAGFTRAFMLANAFSSKDGKTTLAIGKFGDYPFEYISKNGSEFEITPQVTGYVKISELVLNKIEPGRKVNLYLQVIPASDGMLLSHAAFREIDSIYLVPEGTSIFTYSQWRIDNLILFAKKAKAQGVKKVTLILWDSINENALLNSDLTIAQLKNNGIDYKFSNFNNMSKEIKTLDNASALITAALYTGAMNESSLSAPVFKKSQSFDETKENIALLGSYTRDEPQVSLANQIAALTNLERITDLNKYNVIFKGHPSELSVNEWINTNSTSISYFNSFPYEVWQIIGAGEYKYSYNSVDYSLYLPKVPEEIYSIFSTSLYAEDSNKIKIILGYNNIDANTALINTEHSVSINDRAEYTRWQLLTAHTNTPFELIFNWMNTMN